MSSTPIDSKIFKNQFGTDEMRNIFSDEALLQSWLDAEAALAIAEAKLNLIPSDAAREIKNKANYKNFNFDDIRNGLKETSHPLVAFIHELEKKCDEEARKYVHWGATTQDIIDTGLAIQIKRAHKLLFQQVKELLNKCLFLSNEYKSTVMPGRTLGQHALPITFGYKVSIWADELGRHLERLEQGSERYLVGQLAGAAGTLASLGEYAFDVQKLYLEELDLKEPTVSWHTSRDRYAEFSMIIAMISGTVGKIANEIINLQRTEIGELEESFHNGKIGSSTMPHKRNPMVCSYIVGLSHTVRNKAALSLNCMVQEHERDVTLWQTEWSYIPEICILTSGALAQLQNVLENLTINNLRMKSNLNITKGLIVSENIMLGLGKYVGRNEAHDILHEASMRAFDEDKSLEEILLKTKELTDYMNEDEIKYYADPLKYLGHCEEFVKRVINRWRPYYHE